MREQHPSWDESDQHVDAHQHGVLITWPWSYGLILRVALVGRSRRLMQQVTTALQVGAGGRVLDVGCGTGRLSLALAEHVGPEGRSVGVDASAEMVAAAQSKADRSAVPVDFQVARAQALPFADRSFDAVASMLLIHHLPVPDQAPVVAEMLRVLRPGGALVIADFRAPSRPVSRWMAGSILGSAQADSERLSIAELAVSSGVQELTVLETGVSWMRMVAGTKADDPGAKEQ